MTCDSNGIYIAMTGTRWLTKKERSNLKFGGLHTQVFLMTSQSLMVGTLRIKKEQIDTAAKAEIKENLDIENQNHLDSKDVYESDDYIEGVSKYIERISDNLD